eukprot:gene20330-22330_t
MEVGRSSPVAELMMLKNNEDQSQDANTALWELEKGLRTGKVEEQCEAIVRFPALFSKYPYPILVNSAFLKLADVFRGGTNFLKICVLKVIQESSKHLDKILNVDESIRKFYSVIHANDPVARAITLRVFGSISTIVSDRKNIHYSIQNSLDSHDPVEVEAAIFATKCFCKQSKQFAEGIVHKIATMIEGVSTPIEMKLKLIPAFQYMHHDLQTANEVQDLCQSLLTSYPAVDFVLVTLQTLTSLALAIFVNIPSQVNLLLRYTKSDPRIEVKFGALKNLRKLARKSPHLWTRQQVEDLTTFAVESIASDPLKIACLDVLCCLSQSHGSRDCFSKTALEMQELLSDSDNTECATLSLAIKTNVLVERSKEGSIPPLDQLTKLENDTQYVTALSIAENSLSALKRCLSCITHVTRVSTSVKSNFTGFLIEMMSAAHGEQFLEICHCLVKTATNSSADLQKHKMKLSEYLSEEIASNKDDRDDEIVIALVTLILQAAFGLDKQSCVAIQNSLIERLACISEERLWLLYRIGRQASRLGFSLLASSMFEKLVDKVSSESNYLWMSALVKFHKAEFTLMGDCSTQAKTSERLTDAYNHYQDALIDLKASVTPDHAFYFQYKFAKLRSEMLRAYSHLITCCCSLRTCPPPAVAMAVSIATGQDVHQLSRLGSQFQSCAKAFTSIANGFGTLFRTSFNADPSTLQIIKILQESCQLMVYSIEILILNRKEGSVLSSELTNSSIKENSSNIHRNIQAIACMNQNIVEIIEGLATQVKDTQICHLQTQYLCQAIASQLDIPIPYPSYFFKSLQATSIKLTVSPSSKSIHEPILVNIDSQLALKVEGLIEDNDNAGIFRKVSRICLTVKVKASDKSKPAVLDIKGKQPTNLVLEDTVQPRNEYFSSQFLIAFNSTGNHELIIMASVRDENGGCWDTGPQVIVHADVIEHGAIRRSGLKV